MTGPGRRNWARTVGRCRATGKLMYATEHQASIALAKCQLYGRPERRAYRCDRCGCWHLTHARLAVRESVP